MTVLPLHLLTAWYAKPPPRFYDCLGMYSTYHYKLVTTNLTTTKSHPASMHALAGNTRSTLKPLRRLQKLLPGPEKFHLDGVLVDSRSLGQLLHRAALYFLQHQ